ncbi:hypothetical protein [uncultured Lacinutrix sp.]|uniref:hypothetical protein n=1 Tax=uncultured Lacinutrix sp. TaxID=574032 RepID=UPI00262D6ACE|nr:hypothetical protein [uncultured Lacinutrix sp.]
MSDKKHIDRLFQEKFKDFEVKPNANIWDNIQNKIEQPKEETKTKFPIWLRLAGAAAVLVLLFAVGNLLFSNENIKNTNTTVIDTNKNNNTKKHNKVKTTTNESVVTKHKKYIDSKVSNENKLKNNAIATSNKISLDNNTSKINKERSNNLSSQSYNTDNNSKERNNTSLANKNNANTNRNNIVGNSGKENITNSVSNTQKYAQNNTLNNKNNTTYNSNETNFKNSNTVTKNTVINSNNSKNTTTNNTRVADNKNEINTKALDGLGNNIATSNTTVASTDSKKKEEEEEEEKMVDPDSANSSNAIEEALAKNEDLDEEEEENVNRWSVNANIAPVYYNTLGKGSHIHDQFIDNPKNGEINTSYGINIGYALNNKLKIRSGINKLNLSYDTANVIIYENVSNTPNSSPMRNINFVPTSNGQNISVLSTNSFSVQQISGVINDNLNAALSQRLSYVEVPLELEYTVVEKRFGLNLIGGFSTFVLNDNEVVTEVEGRKNKIGEANNINNISFSANAGIGIDYKFNNTVKFSFTPTFKYQINAYNETSGNFKPYIIGVYTGISYKF